MILEKTQKKVLKVIEGLKAGKNLAQALKAAKMTRGHYYSARDGMLRDGNPMMVKAFAGVVKVPSEQPAPPIQDQHQENARLRWAQDLIVEIQSSKKRQDDILKKLMA